MKKVRLAMQNGEINISPRKMPLTKFFGVLDKFYKKDDLSVVCEAWSSYKNLQKKDCDTMEQFLNEYERKVKELKKEGITLPEVVLAMQLLDSTGLDKKEKQIVLTAVDYSKKTEMYDQMKQALRKFFGDQAMTRKERMTEPLIKTEEVNATEAEEAYYTRGRNPVRGGGYAAARGRRWTRTGPLCGEESEPHPCPTLFTKAPFLSSKSNTPPFYVYPLIISLIASILCSL